MPVNKLDILKRLLEEEEPTQPEETSTPKTFEDDPMDFILKKYVTLNNMLSELMTPEFKEYVEGIFIVAPKPTTFKILLHNGQYFFLTYLGKAYQATIVGRNYYLIEIGEKERCMIAISRLLRYGSPLKTKGPEGAEQGTRDEEGGAAEGGGEEAPAPEEGGEEELTEAVITSLIKNKILNEAITNMMLKAVMSALQHQNLSVGKIENKNGGPHIRIPFSNEAAAKSSLESVAKDLGFGKDYTIKLVAPNKFGEGSRSGKFNTYVLTLNKDKGEFKKGMQAHIVSNVKEGKSTISGKSLTPGNLGMSGKAYKSGKDIVAKIEPTVKSKAGQELGEALTLLMKDVSSQSKPKFDDVSKVTDYTTNITFSAPTKKALSTILPADLDTIGKDFGEVLGAISMGNQISLNTGIRFPGGNEPLVDFYVDDYGISSKYKGGAAATLTKIIDQIDPKKISSKSEKKVYDLLKPAFASSTVSGNYLVMAKELDLPALKIVAQMMKKSPEEVTIKDFSELILKIVKKFPEGEDAKADAAIKKSLDPFFKSAGTYPSFPINWGKLSNKKNWYGIITSPLAYGVAKAMNSDPDYSKGLKQIIGKIEIKQLYLDFDLGSSSAIFKLKSFSDPNASFSFVPSNVSVNNPDNGNLGFKMK